MSESKYTKKELEQMLAEKKQEDKFIDSDTGTYSKKILNKLFVGFIIFVSIVLFIFYKTGNEPSILVGGVITFLSVEVWQLARIKISESEVCCDEQEN